MGRRRLGPRRLVLLAVGADLARQPPHLRHRGLVLGIEQQRGEVHAEGAGLVADLVLEQLGPPPQHLDARLPGRRPLEQGRLDRQRVVPLAAAFRQRQDRLADVLAIGRPRERAQEILHGPGAIIEPLFAQLRPAHVQRDPPGAIGGLQRQVEAGQDLLPQLDLVALGRDPLDLGQQLSASGVEAQGVAQGVERAAPVTQAPLRHLGQLAAGRQVGRGIEPGRRLPRGGGRRLRAGRAARLAVGRGRCLGPQRAPLVLVHLGQIAPQAVGLGRAPQLGDGGRVGRLPVGPPVPVERGLVIAQPLGGDLGDALHQRAHLARVAPGPHPPLERVHVARPVAHLSVELGGRRQRLVVVGLRARAPARTPAARGWDR